MFLLFPILAPSREGSYVILAYSLRYQRTEGTRRSTIPKIYRRELELRKKVVSSPQISVDEFINIVPSGIYVLHSYKTRLKSTYWKTFNNFCAHYFYLIIIIFDFSVIILLNFYFFYLFLPRQGLDVSFTTISRFLKFFEILNPFLIRS